MTFVWVYLTFFSLSNVQLLIFCWYNSLLHRVAEVFLKQLSFASHLSVVYRNINYSYLLHSLLPHVTCRFSATDFLVRLRGKRLMLVGDSMNRNQFESILCILREGLQNKSKMYEIHGYKITKGRGYFVFKFEVKFSPYLLKSSVGGHNVVHFAKILKHLGRTIIVLWNLWDLISLWGKEFELMDKGAQILHYQ